MRDLSRRGFSFAFACAPLLAASTALAEERKPAPTAPATKVAPPNKAITVDMDIDQPDMCARKGAKPSPSSRRCKR